MAQSDIRVISKPVEPDDEEWENRRFIVQEADDDGIKEPSEADLTCDYVCVKWRWLQHFRSPQCVVGLISLVAFSQVMLSIGFSGSTITTLERRYRLSSSEAGAILALYEVGSIIISLPISYFFTNSRRLRTVSVTVILMAVGAFIYALPHFLAGLYVYETPVEPICYRNSSAGYQGLCSNKEAGSHLNQFKWMFMLGQLLMGMAAPAAFTLGIPYLDDSLPPDVAPTYLGFTYTCVVLGSAGGFVIGGGFMRMYVDVGAEHPGLEVSNTKQWVGAWWIGFLMTAGILLLTSIPLFGFPKQLPGTAEALRQRKSEAFGDSEKEADKKKMTAKDFLGNMKLLATNATFILLIASSSIDQIKKAGFTAFGAKYYEANFGLSPSMASLMFGGILVLAGGSGIFVGGIIVRAAKFRMRGLLRFIVIINLITIPMDFQLFIPCGPSSAYKGNTGLQHGNASCVGGCQCSMDSIMYEPSCGRNGLTYFSPCFAGCKTSLGQGKYGNCSCLPKLNATNMTSWDVRRGECSGRCPYTRLFVVTSLLAAFTGTLAFTPYVTAILRSVPRSLKPTGLGLNSLLSKIIGQIPGPLIAGRIMDSACSLWTQRCGVRGNCALYDHERMRINIFTINMTVSIIVVILQVVAMLTYRSSESDEDKEKEEGNQRDLAARGEESRPLANAQQDSTSPM